MRWHEVGLLPQLCKSTSRPTKIADMSENRPTVIQERIIGPHFPLYAAAYEAKIQSDSKMSCMAHNQVKN